MVHVWQHQIGQNVVWRALQNRKYAYKIEEGKDFSKYGVEQQGEIIADYFYLLNNMWYKNKKRPDIKVYQKLIPFVKK